MCHFILMLTKDDKTVPDARAVYGAIRNSSVRYVGFKDIGLPHEELVELASEIKRDGRTVLLEVVSTTKEAELASVEAARRIGVDYLLGGRHVEDVVKLLKGRAIRYFPFAGKTIGHPTKLVGTMEEIVDDARKLARTPGVHGLDLLAYRFDGDAPLLAERVVKAVEVPVIVAGSIDTPGRVAAIRQAGAWGFTVGSALFQGAFLTEPLKLQVESILQLEGVKA